MRLLVTFSVSCLLVVACSGDGRDDFSVAVTTSTSTTSAAAESTTTVAAVADGRPRANEDHFHSTYLIYVCGEKVRPFPEDSRDDITGIHTHGEGLIHIHPFQERVAGKNATLGVFFTESLGHLSDHLIAVPSGEFEEGIDSCGGEPADIRVLKWDTVDDVSPTVYTEELAGIRFDQPHQREGQLFTIAFVASSTSDRSIPRPDDTLLREYLGLPPVEVALGR